MRYIIGVVWIVFSFPSYAQGGFTEQDRQKIDNNFEELHKIIYDFKLESEKRFTTLEVRQTESEKSINQRFDITNAIMLTILGGVFVLIGYIVWDRKTTLKPFVIKSEEFERDLKQLKEQTQEIKKAIDVLKELSKDNPKLADILKNLGIY